MILILILCFLSLNILTFADESELPAEDIVIEEFVKIDQEITAIGVDGEPHEADGELFDIQYEQIDISTEQIDIPIESDTESLPELVPELSEGSSGSGGSAFSDVAEVREVDDFDYLDADFFRNAILDAVRSILSEEEEESDIEPLQFDDDEILETPLLSSPFRSGRSVYKNVVVYHGSFGGSDCDLVIPYNAYASLLVENGYLVNVGGSNVTGKLLYAGDTLDPTDYDTYSYILTPIYGSSSNAYNYGSYNYQRHYYVNQGRITQTDTYGNFIVSDCDVYYSASERTYYILMIILLFMGVNWLWCRRH